MPPHIDQYSWRGEVGETTNWNDSVRIYEGEEAVAYAARVKLPRFNGYLLLTALHEDGECIEHRPDDPVWVETDVDVSSTDVQRMFKANLDFF